jgi:predicted RNA-binding Zn-ribbon protein involved in translation (DUF1610 family)
MCDVGPMGISHEYLCNGCGNEFGAEEGFSFGFFGEVYTTVVCAEHGIGDAKAGINVAQGGEISSVERLETFPCPECGKEAPRWDRKTCPKCGAETLEVVGEILWD